MTVSADFFVKKQLFNSFMHRIGFLKYTKITDESKKYVNN